MLPPLRFLFDPKAVWRERMKTNRRDAAKARPDADVHASRIFLDTISIPDNAVVALYHPIGDELDTKPLANALLDRGVSLALPVATKKPAPLIFRTFRAGDALEAGAFGIQVPPSTAAEIRPDIIVVPLLGFTRAGERLGYGGGYYDRTLQALRGAGGVTAIGFAFGAQEVDALPSGPLDQRLDWIVTERGAIRCS